MNITITWEATGVICAVLGMLAASLAWFVRSIVREELGKFVEAYVGVPVFEAYVESVLERLEALERRHAS